MGLPLSVCPLKKPGAAAAAEVAGRVVERPEGLEAGMAGDEGDLLATRDPRDYESRVLAARKQAESLEKKYTLEEKLRRCSAKTTLGKFRRRRKARLVFHLNNNRSFEVNIRSRNLVGELKILPKEPVVNVLFTGPNRYFKFEVLNTFGKMLKILKVKNKPMKIGLFEAYSSKKFIASSPKPGKVNKSNFSRLT